jgi:acetyl esterase/lipase
MKAPSERLPDGSIAFPARTIPAPVGISEAARAHLAALQSEVTEHPALDDAAAWRKKIDAFENGRAAALAAAVAAMPSEVQTISLGGVRTVVATPHQDKLLDASQVLLDFHGGAFIYGGGELCAGFYGAGMAMRTGRVCYAVDYPMPPESPYPAGLNAGLSAYRALLAQHPAGDVIVTGSSAGGGLAVAMLYRARAEGLPMPAGLLLLTPSVDLTGGGDSFSTLRGLDSLEPHPEVNALYAAGADLTDPLLSPLFGDVSGFPPTFLQAGTRDLMLSNAVRFHRKLRQAGVKAELHVWEAMPHRGFGGRSPEDLDLSAEMQAFLGSL